MHGARSGIRRALLRGARARRRLRRGVSRGTEVRYPNLRLERIAAVREGLSARASRQCMGGRARSTGARNHALARRWNVIEDLTRGRPNSWDSAAHSPAISGCKTGRLSSTECACAPASDRAADEGLAKLEAGSRVDLRDHPSIIALVTGRPASSMMGVQGTGRDTRWISINTRPLTHAGSAKPYAALSSIIDVTDRVRAQEAERRARE